MHIFTAHTIHAVAWHIVGIGKAVYIQHLRGTLYRGTHGIEVVLTHKYHRQLPQHRHIESLVQYALPCSPIAKHTDGGPVGTLVLLGKSYAGAQAYLPAHNAMAAKKPFLLREKVHTAALSLGAAGGFTIKFGHALLCGYALGNGQAMIAVSGNEVIIIAQRGHHSCSNRFLPYIQMAKPADLLHTI